MASTAKFFHGLPVDFIAGTDNGGMKYWFLGLPLTKLLSLAVAGILKRYSGAAWDQKIIKSYTGAAWVEKPLKRYTGSTWSTVDTSP